MSMVEDEWQQFWGFLVGRGRGEGREMSKGNFEDQDDNYYY